MIRLFASRQFFVFLITGGVAAVVNFGSRILYNQFMGFSPAVVAAFITGMTMAFVLAKIFVFKHSTKPLYRSAFFFLLINLFALLQTWIISVVLVFYILPACGIVFFTKEIAHATGILVPAFTSYLGHKHISFR